ncbi:MAG TPA: protease pro-enzyme activation domain-containing protein [Edaphobacter sp.]
MPFICRVLRPLFVVTLLFCFLPAFAQRPEPRLKGSITETDRVVLANSRTPRVRTAQDEGEVASDTVVPGITLVFRRSAAQEAALKELLAAQQNPASPLYHQWLSTEEFATRFGAADEDIATTESWLTSRGFHVDGVPRSRDRITFSGTAAQVQAAFGTELRRYQEEGELHFAPAADLTLPANLASVTEAVLHLSDFRPKPSFAAAVRPSPNYTAASTQAHYLGPKDVATMYNLKPLYQRGFYGGGQGLAIVGQSYVDTTNGSKIQVFQNNVAQYTYISPVLVPGSGVQAISPGDQGESELDLEYSSGIAQQANIFFVYVGSNRNYSVFDALDFAITQNIAPVVSISYGVCEPILSQTELDQANSLFEEAAAQGQTIVASSGDSGSTACEVYSTSQGVTLDQQQALAVSFPASSPNVTAVGGTQMAAGTFTAGNTAYWASAGSVDQVGSLLSYVPEVVWNEGSAANGIIAGGGGVSIHYPRPAWQSGIQGITSGAYRLVPDVALQSSIGSPGFLLCTNDRSLMVSGQTSSCVNGLQGNNGKYTLAGGTSFAAPIFAGYLAILNQAEHTNGQGNINPTLYSLAANPTTYAAAFHDITTGTIGCVTGAAKCTAAGAANYGATVGYDQATGLGSVDFNALTTAWPSSSNTNLIPTTMLLIGSSTAVPGSTVSFQISVQRSTSSASTAIPSGSVSISVDGVVVSQAQALTAADPVYGVARATYNVTAPSAAGSHLVTVTYSGDATFLPSTSTYSILVGNVVATGGIGLSVANVTIANGATGNTQVTVTPAGGYNGRLVWSLSVTGNSSNLTACYGISSLPVNSVSTTQLTIGVGAACTSPSAAGRTVTTSGSPQALWRGTSKTAVYAALLLCGVLARRRKLHWSSLLAIAFLAVIGGGLVGCSGGGGSSTGTPSTPTAPSSTSYTLSLKGTDSVNPAITSSTTFMLTVN